MLILLLSSCAFAPLPNEAAKELAPLQGRWIVWGSEQLGEYNESGERSQSFITIKDDLLIYKVGNGVFYSARIRIIRPGVIDLLPIDKRFKGERWEGIYKIENEKLTICHAMVDRENAADSESGKRPEQFKTAKTTYILYVLKRVKE